MDCAAFCQLAAKLSAHHSPLAHFAHQACAEACRACADVCDAVPNDPTLQQCAEYCRKCAEACDQMAKEKAHGSDEHHPAKHQKQQEERKL
jgi:hypothetical protein